MRAAVFATLLGLLPALAFGQPPDRAGLYQMAFQAPGVGPMRYALSLPRGFRPGQQHAFVLVLHPGGERFPYYGGAFLEQIVRPALGGLDAIMIAPDCPTSAWTDAAAERAVLALVRATLGQYDIDRRRVLVTGFSLGGRGTWFFAAHHGDLFTAAIPMAGSLGDDRAGDVADIPIYVIHSRDDEVVPFANSERAVEALRALGRAVEFEPLSGMTHFQMDRYVDALRRGGEWIGEQWKVRK
jgi:predicted peptidase